MNRMCSTIVVLAIAVRALLAGSVADAETYPSRVIRLILPQPAGGAVDLIARSLGENISESLGQPVIVENVPGANGGVAAERVIRSAPDGYTLMVAVDSNLVVNPSLYTNLTYDPFHDFVSISIIAGLYMVLVANPDVPANTVAELIAYAKAHPNKLNYGGLTWARHRKWEWSFSRLSPGRRSIRSNIEAHRRRWRILSQGRSTSCLPGRPPPRLCPMPES